MRIVYYSRGPAQDPLEWGIPGRVPISQDRWAELSVPLDDQNDQPYWREGTSNDEAGVCHYGHFVGE